MEATKRAGALDLQGGQYKRSALHWASAKGLAGTVAQLLALGADATLTDKEGKTAVEHAGNDKVKAAFVEHAEHSDITDDNKDALLLLCAYRGLAPRVRAVLQAGANAGHINQVRVRARFRGSGSWVSVCLCPHVFSYRAIHDMRIHVHHTSQ
jgi:ankyrin repeat protein